MANVFTYAAKILTNQNKQDQAEETLEALNGIIQNNHGLKSWALGELEKFSVMLRRMWKRNLRSITARWCTATL